MDTTRLSCRTAPAWSLSSKSHYHVFTAMLHGALLTFDTLLVLFHRMQRKQRIPIKFSVVCDIMHTAAFMLKQACGFLCAGQQASPRAQLLASAASVSVRLHCKAQRKPRQSQAPQEVSSPQGVPQPQPWLLIIPSHLHGLNASASWNLATSALHFACVSSLNYTRRERHTRVPACPTVSTCLAVWLPLHACFAHPQNQMLFCMPQAQGLQQVAATSLGPSHS